MCRIARDLVLLELARDADEIECEEGADDDRVGARGDREDQKVAPIPQLRVDAAVIRHALVEDEGANTVEERTHGLPHDGTPRCLLQVAHLSKQARG